MSTTRQQTTAPPRSAPAGQDQSLQQLAHQAPGAGAGPQPSGRLCPICRRGACRDLQCARDMDTTHYAQ